MKYKELPKDIKQRISGSINNSLKACTSLSTISFENIFNEWFNRKIYFIQGKWYYNFLGYKVCNDKIKFKSTYMIDNDIVNELKDIMKERYIKRCKIIQQNKEEYLKKAKNNLATREKLEIAYKLHLKAHGTYKYYNDKQYTMFEIDRIIKELKNKIQYDNWEKVVY